MDPVDVEKAYSYIASRYNSIKRHVQSHGQCNATFGQEEDSVEGRLALCCEGSSTEADQILCWSDSIDGYASDFGTYPQSFPKVAIV
jgi:hypothetical protein